LYPKPRINGFDIAGPVLTAFTPGTSLDKASMALVAEVFMNSSLFITLTGCGFCFILVAA